MYIERLEDVGKKLKNGIVFIKNYLQPLRYFQ